MQQLRRSYDTLKTRIEQSILHGSFDLSHADTKSDFYVNIKPLLLDPAMLHLLIPRIAPYLYSIDAVGGLELSASLLAPVLAYAYSISAFTIRKQAKQYGLTNRLISPISLAEKHVLLIDDVYTTGASLQDAANVLYEEGAYVKRLVIVNRSTHDIPALFTVSAEGKIL